MRTNTTGKDPESALDQRIRSFKPISLAAMDQVKLLNRQDTKYVFSIDRLEEVLGELSEQYDILEIDGHRDMTYRSLYFDTPDLQLYNDHHNGKLNRYKIRYRRYVETNTCFFEIKFKSNKNRTIKSRINQPDITDLPTQPCLDLIAQQSTLPGDALGATLWIYFTRITLVDKHRQERLTIDRHLSFEKDGKKKALHRLVIAEIKQNRFSTKSVFVSTMRKMHIAPMRLSKYCTGMLLTHDHLKYNRFKPKLLTLNKLENAVA